jgi:hypothetical protein
MRALQTFVSCAVRFILAPAGRIPTGEDEMKSLPFGALVAAVVMFFLGFVFFGLLGTTLFAPLDPATGGAVQASLGQQLPATGSYMVPADEEGWMVGPGAVIDFVAAGDSPSMAMAMGLGFLHFFVTALLIGFALKAAGGGRARRMAVALWFGLAATVFGHLGDPIWYGFSWRGHLIEFVFDAIIFITGGLILARWFTASDRAA